MNKSSSSSGIKCLSDLHRLYKVIKNDVNVVERIRLPISGIVVCNNRVSNYTVYEVLPFVYEGEKGGVYVTVLNLDSPSV